MRHSLTIVGTLVGLALGHYFSMVLPPARQQLSLRSEIPLEFLADKATFSEVESAKELLSAECRYFIANLRSQYLGVPDRAAAARQAVPVLEEKLPEYKGSAQEFALREELLMTLAFAKLYDRWLDTFLAILYESPTQPLIGRWLGKAIQFSALTNREAELSSGLQHLLRIPRDFDAKRTVLRMAWVGSEPPLTQAAGPARPFAFLGRDRSRNQLAQFDDQ